MKNFYQKIEPILAFGLLAIILVGVGILNYNLTGSYYPNYSFKYISSETEDVKINFLDVGQGEATFIEMPENQCALIDAGTADAGEAIVQYIKERGYEKIDYIFITNPHDHRIGGMSTIINEMPVELIYTPAVTNTTDLYTDLIKNIIEKKINIKYADNIENSNENLIKSSLIKMIAIAPNSDEYADLNNYSLVLKMTYGENDFLFMSDAEETSEMEILSKEIEVDSDVIKIGSHGSKSFGSKEFIQAVSPSYGIICRGAQNSLTDIESLRPLEEFNVVTYKSEEGNHIVATSDSKNITIDTIESKSPSENDN